MHLANLKLLMMSLQLVPIHLARLNLLMVSIAMLIPKNRLNVLLRFVVVRYAGDSNEISFLETVPNDTDLRRPRIANGKSFLFKIDLEESFSLEVKGMLTSGIEL